MSEKICNCGPDQLLLFIENELPAHESIMIATHIEHCKPCEGLVHDLETGRRLIRSLRKSDIDFDRVLKDLQDADSTSSVRDATETAGNGDVYNCESYSNGTLGRSARATTTEDGVIRALETLEQGRIWRIGEFRDTFPLYRCEYRVALELADGDQLIGIYVSDLGADDLFEFRPAVMMAANSKTGWRSTQGGLCFPQSERIGMRIAQETTGGYVLRLFNCPDGSVPRFIVIRDRRPKKHAES